MEGVVVCPFGPSPAAALMGFTYHHLDEADVRAAMVELWQAEWEEMHARQHPDACYGKQLNDAGWAAWGQAMPEALKEQDDEWLRGEMSDLALWDATYPRAKPKGGITLVKYNKPDAIRRLSYGEFNIAYIRGLATALLARGETHCEAYRAEDAYQPRGECSGWEGEQFALEAVIAGHRARYYPAPGEPGAFSIPSGPNCHHSIRALRH
jgi:hypothetical protein